MTFLKNTWYVACGADEIETDKPLGRTICNQPLVLYRGAGGQVSALEDFCPHRGAPLSLGRVVDGRLVCGYHGLVMGCDGHAVSMPGQRTQAFTPIRRFPVVERHGFIWFWPGDAQLADPALIPSFEWSGHPEWAYGGGLYHVACDYRLMLDNLMDLTHETYVHADSIGQKEIEDVLPKTKQEGEQVVTRRHMTNVLAPPFWQAALRGNGLADDVLVDRWQICRFTPPSHVMIDVGVAHAGHGGFDAPAAVKASSVVVDFLTPETESTMWYFWGMARHFKPDDAALTETIRAGQATIFSEDLQLLQAQQKNLLAQPQRRLMTLNIDAGGVLSRRVIDRLLTAESAAVADRD